MDEKNAKICSFFGHRNTEITVELEQKVKKLVEGLIVKYHVTTLFKKVLEAKCR